MSYSLFLTTMALFLTTSIHAQDPAVLSFAGDEYNLSAVTDTGPTIENHYVLKEKKDDTSERTIIRGMIIGVEDCLAFSKARKEMMTKDQPDRLFNIVPSSNINIAIFATMGVDDEKPDSYACEAWLVGREFPDSPAVFFTRFLITKSGPNAKKSLRTLTDATMPGWLQELKTGNFPMLQLPKVSETIDLKETDIGANQAKGTNSGAVCKVDSNFAIKLGVPEGTELPPAPPAPFQVTIPKRYEDKVILNGRPNSAETASFALTDKNKMAIESVQFFDLNHSKVEDTAIMLPALIGMMETNFAQPVVVDQGGKILGRYETSINGMPTAVVLAQSGPDSEFPYIYKYVALPRANATCGLVIVLRSDPTQSSDVNGPEDFNKKGLCAEILHSVKFLNP